MHKFWKQGQSKQNNLILIKNEIIYTGNLDKEDFIKLTSESKELHFLPKLFSIPFSYISKIENQEGNKFLCLHLGSESQEEIYFIEDSLKKEVFQYLRRELHKFDYIKEKTSVLKYAKAPLMAILITSVLFAWVLYLGLQIEQGFDYQLDSVRNRNSTIMGIILGLANLGSKKIAIAFLSILAICLLALKKKLNSRSESEILILK